VNGQCEKIGELVAEYSTPPQSLPLGIPTVRIAIIEKRRAREGRWEEGNGGSGGLASSLSPSHRPPCAFFFPCLQSPYDTKRSLRKKEKLYYKSIFNERGFSVLVAKNG